MTEIKFRYVLKNKMDKKIDYLYFTLLEIEEYDYHPINRRDWEIISREQFTGLHDKNGKEIYEGDIVDCGDIHLVFWDNNDLGWSLSISTNSLTSYTLCQMQNNIEVIGNIHENPELIK